MAVFLELVAPVGRTSGRTCVVAPVITQGALGDSQGALGDSKGALGDSKGALGTRLGATQVRLQVSP